MAEYGQVCSSIVSYSQLWQNKSNMSKYDGKIWPEMDQDGQLWSSLGVYCQLLSIMAYYVQ